MQENVGPIKNLRGCPPLFKIDEENFIHPSPITPLAHEHVFAWITERPPKKWKMLSLKIRLTFCSRFTSAKQSAWPEAFVAEASARNLSFVPTTSQRPKDASTSICLRPAFTLRQSLLRPGSKFWSNLGTKICSTPTESQSSGITGNTQSPNLSISNSREELTSQSTLRHRR